MKMIVAYIRPNVQDQVVERLQNMEIPGTSLSPVQGFGGGRYDRRGAVRPSGVPYTEIGKLEAACPDARADELAEGLADVARTGRFGERIFVLPVYHSIATFGPMSRRCPNSTEVSFAP